MFSPTCFPGEAEYVVAVFMFMRLLGYPAEKISIITSYNGQKALIRDVLERRCASHVLFGRPARVTTVDKFQGQQNDCTLRPPNPTNQSSCLSYDWNRISSIPDALVHS